MKFLIDSFDGFWLGAFNHRVGTVEGESIKPSGAHEPQVKAVNKFRLADKAKLLQAYWAGTFVAVIIWQSLSLRNSNWRDCI